MPPNVYSHADSLFLTTFGAGSALADKCVEYYLKKGTYIKQLQLYKQPNYGISGTLFVLSNGEFKAFGDITGTASFHQFTETLSFIGFAGASSTGLSPNNILSLSVITQ